MPTTEFTRAEDLLDTSGSLAVGGALTHSLLAGTWLNTDRTTKWITRIVLESRQDGLWVQPFGATPQGGRVWEPVDSKGVFTAGVIAHDAVAFTAYYRFGPWETPLRGYWNKGLLVVAGLNTTADNRGHSYLSREFFRRQGEGPRAAEGAVDPNPLVGAWWNADQASGGFERIDLAIHEGAVRIHVWGAGSPAARDWGQTTGRLYAEAAGPSRVMCIAAFYDFGFLEADLHAYEKKGVLVVESFSTFKDGSGRSPYFAREFFYH
jgi:hypothetical protein